MPVTAHPGCARPSAREHGEEPKATRQGPSTKPKAAVQTSRFALWNTRDAATRSTTPASAREERGSASDQDDDAGGADKAAKEARQCHDNGDGLAGLALVRQASWRGECVEDQQGVLRRKGGGTMSPPSHEDQRGMKVSHHQTSPMTRKPLVSRSLSVNSCGGCSASFSLMIRTPWGG